MEPAAGLARPLPPLLFAGLISLFALDVFEENQGFWNTTLALLMHLIPTAILLLILAVSWRWEWIGGVIFPALGACLRMPSLRTSGTHFCS